MSSKAIAQTAYARLPLDRALPAEAERCLYLDCDLVVQRDIAEVWAFALKGRTLAAVSAGERSDVEGHQSRLGLRG